ncbi:MAG: cytochrome C [Candidatus Anammoxibacter sp.]
MENFLHNLLAKDNEVIVIFGIFVLAALVVSFTQAIINDRRMARGEKIIELSYPDGPAGDYKVLSWPYLVRKEFLAFIIITFGLLAWGVITNAPLEEHSNPNLTPNPSKAPWYFLGLQEMLVYFDPWIAGVVMPAIILKGLMAIPYIDINPKGSGYYTLKERPFAIGTFIFGFVFLWVMLIVVGVFLRGPGWIIFMPWEYWDPHTIIAETNIDMTQFIGIDSASLLGNIIGFLVVSGYFVVGMTVPYIILRKNATVVKLGMIRYSIVAFLFVAMIGLPIKIFLRLVLHLKYIWVCGWEGINFFNI